MNFSRLLFVLCAFLCFSPLCLAAERPNIIVVLTDDQGYGDFGCKGNPVIQTPHLDQFAKDSFEFTRFYVNPVCSPTRASFLTGRNAYRTGVTDTFKGGSIMRAEEVTLPEVLKDAGYATGLFGKWHLGDNYPYRAQDQGFEYALYHLGGGLGQPSEPLENKRRYTDAILFENGKKLQTKGYCCDVYFDEAIKWYRKEARAGKPFFAYIASNTPHSPFHDVPEKWLKYYQNIDYSKFPEMGFPVKEQFKTQKSKDVLAAVYAMVSNIDENMGKLMAALEEDGQLKNTIVIFFNDNGPGTSRFVSGFRGKKTMCTEAGIRTPIWWYYKGKFEAGGTSDLLAAHYDIMPTLLEICGLKMPKGKTIDGRSILPALEGKTQTWDDDRTIFMQWHRGSRPVKNNHIAVIQKEWKLHSPWYTKGPVPSAPGFELHEIEKDPYEQTNVIQQYPEKSKAMRAAYEGWLESLNDEYPAMWAPLPIIVNPEAEPEIYLTRQEWHEVKDPAKGMANGQWLFEFPQGGDFEISFVLKDAKEMVKASLVLDGKVVQSAELIKAKDGRYHFKTQKIEKGSLPLRIDIPTGKKTVGPWHAFVKKI